MTSGDDAQRLAARAVERAMAVVREWNGPSAEAEPAAELAMTQLLRAAEPDAAIVGDISGGTAGDGRVWVVDAVDGTENFLRGDPFVGVTAALLVGRRPVAGATGCPFTGELWSATEGAGAVDAAGRPLRFDEPLGGPVVLDPAVSNEAKRPRWETARTRLVHAYGEVELRSALALELAYVAVGEFAAAVHVGGSPVQDFAAGMLLVGEAGGAVRALDPSRRPWESEIVVAGSSRTVRELTDLLATLD